MGHNQELGRRGEDAVAERLIGEGNAILDRNWRIPEGEIDLIAQQPDGVILFVEVKTRSTLRFGHPLEAIDPKKALRMHRLALAWLSLHGSFGVSYRIDGASVLQDGQQLVIDYRRSVA